VTEKVQLLRDELKVLRALHDGLSKQARQGEAAISKQALEYYPHALENFSANLQALMRLVDPLRFTRLQRARRRLSSRFRRRPRAPALSS
jgi:hypothetical protein